MKRSKLEQFVKRLPNDALFELFEVLIDEFNKRKAKGSRMNGRVNQICGKSADIILVDEAIKTEVKELEQC